MRCNAFNHYEDGLRELETLLQSIKIFLLSRAGLGVRITISALTSHESQLNNFYNCLV